MSTGENRPSRRITAGYAFVALSAVIYGLSPMLACVCMEKGMDQITVEFFISVAALPLSMMLALRYHRSLRVPKAERGSLLILGLLITATNVLLISSYLWIPSGTATTLHFLYPVLVTMLSWLFFRSRVGKRVIIGLIACLAGAFFFLLENSSDNRAGIFCALASSLTYSLYIVILAQKIKRTSAFVMVFYLMLIQMLICCGVTLFRGTLRFDYQPIVWVIIALLAAMNGIAASVLFRMGVDRVGPSQAALLSLLEPIVSIVAGAVILGDPFSMRTLLGCICTLCGLLFATQGSHRAA